MNKLAQQTSAYDLSKDIRIMENEPLNVWVLRGCYLWGLDRVSLHVFAHSPSCRTAGSACTRTLLLSSNTCTLLTTAIFPLHSKVSAKPNRGLKQGLNCMTWATHTAKNSQMPLDLALSSEGFVVLPCQMKPVLPAGSFTQIPAEEDSLTPNCWTAPSQLCIFLPPQGMVFVSLLSQWF